MHTDDLQTKAMNSLLSLVCSMYKVRFSVIQSRISIRWCYLPARFHLLLFSFVPRARRYQSVAENRDILEATAINSDTAALHAVKSCLAPGVATKKGTLRIFIPYFLNVILSLKGKWITHHSYSHNTNKSHFWKKKKEHVVSLWVFFKNPKHFWKHLSSSG